MDRATGPVTHSFGQDPQGSLICTDTGRFSAHANRRDRPRFTDPDQINGTREEVDAGLKGRISYYGTYVLHPEDGFVVHQVHGSMFPNWEGSAQIRFFELKADRLSLNTPPLLSGGGQAVARLVWEKFSIAGRPESPERAWKSGQSPPRYNAPVDHQQIAEYRGCAENLRQKNGLDRSGGAVELEIAPVIEPD